MRGAAFLRWRIRVFFLGAALGLAGIFLNRSWLVTAGMVVLLVGVLLRALPEGDPDSGEPGPSTQKPGMRPASTQEPKAREP